LGGTRDAADVLQETNLALWKNMGEFDPERDFGVWARKFAYLQVMRQRQKQSRDRHVSNFNDELLGKMASKLEAVAGVFADRLRLLDDCIEKLSDYQRELVRMRYAERLGAKAISELLNKSENNIASALYRARLSLIDCIHSASEPGNSP
jgi:RNA polymerase sigma-70 factor, ECF subfamily